MFEIILKCQVEKKIVVVVNLIHVAVLVDNLLINPYFILVISNKKDWQRAIYTLSVQRPSSTVLTHRQEEEKRKTVDDKKGASG